MKRRILPLLSLVLTLAGPSFADFKGSFREGVKAYDQQDWAEVVRYMTEALQDRPHADKVSVAIFSTKRVTYIPNTFLGIALYHLDRCEEAVPHFEDSETQGIAPARERGYFSEMVEARGKCTGKLMDSSIAAAGRAMEEAAGVKAKVDAMKSDPAAAAIMDQSPEVQAKLERAQDFMKGAQERLEAGTQARNFQIVRDAGEYAKRAETELADLEKMMREKVAAGAGEALRAAQQALGAAKSAKQALERYRTGADVSAVWARNSGLAGLESEGDQLLASAERGIGSAGADVSKIEKASKDADAARLKFEEAQNQARQRVAQERRQRQNAQQVAEEAGSSIAAAQRALEGLDRYRSADALRDAWADGGRLGSREAELSAKLDQARSALSAGTSSSDAQRLGRAGDLAEEARAGFESLAGEAQQLLAAASAPADQGTATIATTPSQNGEAVPAPPQALRDAVAAYFSGDYQGTVDRLADEVFDEPKATAQAYLFRAAARFALWQLGGRQDQSLRDAVDRDISTGKASNPALRAEARFFPPPFVELVRSGG